MSSPTFKKFNDNMKTKVEGSKWSSLNEVVESFNSVSLMPGIKDQDDIFTRPSPPKHRISPSQLELLQSMECGRKRTPSPERFSPVSIGRGRIIKMMEERIAPKLRDEALQNDIRATKISTYSNASIENYFKDRCYVPQDCNDDKDMSVLPEEDISNVTSSDEPLVNSSLRVNAKEFFPVGTAPNPVELSESLRKVKQSHEPSRSPVNVKKDANSSLSPHSVKHFSKKTSSSQVNGSFLNQSCAQKNDSHIGFYISSDDDKDDEIIVKNEIETKSTSESFTPYSTTFTSSSQSTGSPVLLSSISPVSLPPSKEEIKPLPIQKEAEQDASAGTKPPRQKRVMRNALLSSLTSKNPSQQQNHLMKPTDFGPGSSSFQPSTVSAFHPFEAECSKSKEHQLARPYDFKTDPLIGPETKDLISALTSESGSLSSLSLTPDTSSSSSASPAHPKEPKPLSFYSFKLQEEDFPPLI